MKQILTTLLLLCSLAVSAQDVKVTGPKKEQATSVNSKKQKANQEAVRRRAEEKRKEQERQEQLQMEQEQKEYARRMRQKEQEERERIEREEAAKYLPSGFEQNHGYVDLGLSVKWATCNIGATNIEESGYYFAWGEISPKYNYSENTYKFTKKYNKRDRWNIKYSKYVTDKNHGRIDNKQHWKLKMMQRLLTGKDLGGCPQCPKRKN